MTKKTLAQIQAQIYKLRSRSYLGEGSGGLVQRIKVAIAEYDLTAEDLGLVASRGPVRTARGSAPKSVDTALAVKGAKSVKPTATKKAAKAVKSASGKATPKVRSVIKYADGRGIRGRALASGPGGFWRRWRLGVRQKNLRVTAADA